jgi:hypothetical protein
MRVLPLFALLVGTSVPGFAEHLVPPALSAQDVTSQLRPVSDEIERCYLDRTAQVRGAGHLELVLYVSRQGVLEHLDVNTPGLPTKVAKDIAGCIRAAVTSISFPARKVFTTATVPYFFQHTPGPGPQLSCWNPNGCHGTHASSE